jgi:hypothetical protein
LARLLQIISLAFRADVGIELAVVGSFVRGLNSLVTFSPPDHINAFDFGAFLFLATVNAVAVVSILGTIYFMKPNRSLNYDWSGVLSFAIESVSGSFILPGAHCIAHVGADPRSIAMVFVAATLTATAFAVRRFARRLLGFLAAPRPSLMASIGLDRVLAKQSISSWSSSSAASADDFTGFQSSSAFL